MPDRATSVSAVFLSYNSERFAGEALRSVLAQDCDPMEIVVSDDASSDATADILRGEIEAYEGPHRVRLYTRNENAGSKSAHLNDAFTRATGDVYISFDDDDVSDPLRARKIVEAFRADPKIQAVYSTFGRMDEEGRRLGRGKVPSPPSHSGTNRWFAKVDAFAAGTTLAVRREVVERFAPLDPDIHEDVVLPFRASLLGEVRFLDEELVMARVRGGSLTADHGRFASLEKYRKRMLFGIQKARKHRASRLEDLRAARELLPERAEEFRQLESVVDASMADAEASAGLVDSALHRRLGAYLHLLRSGAYPEDRAQNLWLALSPASYLRYKRRKLGSEPADGT